MKAQIKILLLILTVSVAACSNNLYSDKETNNLQGSWELRNIKGGFRQPNSPSDFEPGNGTIIKFDGDKFEMTDRKSTPVRTGTYSVINEPKVINGQEIAQKVVYTEETGQNSQHFKLSGNKLILYVGEIASDGYEATYEKL